MTKQREKERHAPVLIGPVQPSKSGPEAVDTKSGQHPYSVREQPGSSSMSPDASSSSSCPGQPRLCGPTQHNQ